MQKQTKKRGAPPQNEWCAHKSRHPEAGEHCVIGVHTQKKNTKEVSASVKVAHTEAGTSRHESIAWLRRAPKVNEQSRLPSQKLCTQKVDKTGA
eukprot:scaffold157949_cov19-Tisochrysis_lutea.AAC.1